MKTLMKKTALSAVLIALALFLVTCGLELPEGGESEIAYVDWEYEEMPDGSAQLTMYLDGTVVPVTATTSRSLGLPLAKMSHDYFEVVFAYQGGAPGNITAVARATWELGQASGISGVYRSDPGVDYRPVTAPTAGAGEGASIVFVGRKQTMTLMGVGFLTHINKLPIVSGTPSAGQIGPLLTTAHRSVTFTVSPLSANIGINPTTGFATTDPVSSFLTATNAADADKPTQAGVTTGNTKGSVTPLGGTDYPLFELPDYASGGNIITVAAGGETLTDGTTLAAGSTHKKIAAKYTIGGLTGVTAPGQVWVVPNSGNLTPAVLLYDLPEIIKREPRYISGGQTWYAVAQVDYRATLVDLDQAAYGTAIGVSTPLNQGNVRGVSVVADLPMNFYLTTPSNGIFSIVFSIPVYALTQLDSTNGNAAPYAEIWHITPGYGQNLYNLDNGIDAGGCVLLGINVSSLDWLEIFTTGMGFKH